MTDAALPEVPPRGVWARLAAHRLALLGLALIALTVLAAIFAPVLTQFSPDEQMFDGLTLEGAPLPPGGAYLLGTDLLGRDLLSRLLYGARTSLVIGIVANGTAVAIGTLVGVTAGYLPRLDRRGLMRFTDLMMAFPALLLAIVLAAIFQPSLWIVALVIAMVNWVQIARVHLHRDHGAGRARVHRRPTRAIGAAHGRILVPPHPAAPGADDASSGARSASRPRCCWRRRSASSASGCSRRRRPGATSSSRTRPTSRSAPWLVFIPGAAILLLALAFNLVGDALRDVLDPTQKGRG